MNRSETIGKIALALAAAQGQISPAPRDSANPFFKSRYADLASIWSACRAPLAAQGLAVIQIPRAAGKTVTVETVLAHSSGEWIGDELTTEAKDSSPQSVGSAITYLRRYALSAMVGIAPDDDDGECAQGRDPARRAAKPAPAPVEQGAASGQPANLAAKLAVRIEQSTSIRPSLIDIAAEAEVALKRGLLGQPERDALFAALTARKLALVAGVTQ